MSLNVKLVAVIAFASLVNTHPTTSQPQLEKGQSEDVHKLPIEEQFLPRDSYLPYEPQLPLNFQLPKAEPNPVPFYAPEPIAFLKPPQEDRAPNYYQAPLPALDLEPPVETEWNPSNDPKLYYEVPSVLTKQELPTKLHPKKYNVEVHLKKKPYSLKPKHELVLEPIDEEQYEAKQKETQKAFQALFKKENQKQIEAIQVQKNPKKTNETEPEPAGSSLLDYSVGDSNAAPSTTFDQGLSTQITSSLGISSPNAASSSGERLMFHMVGHDGPLSYKWGYDTGKGPDRQFRFEERDKAGVVKGHYGYYDKHGKLQTVHYDAHPHHGFHAEGNFDKS